ncbi:MAG TPA: histidine phosphatase family protein [Verrucomicrobiae bacterium]|nr:histidine phosphatase family protein [Verrucomicrobiae bacterium]
MKSRNVPQGTGVLYLVRHGAAMEGPDDDVRPLSGYGQREARELAVFLKGGGLVPDTLWTSRKKRAVDTARILSEELGCPAAEQKAWLFPESSPQTAFGNIEEYFVEYPAGKLLVVSHLPLLPQLASLLTPSNWATCSMIPTAGCLHFEKTTVWSLEQVIAPGRS